MSPSRERHLAYVGLIVATLFWAINAVVARLVADEIPALSVSFWRWFGALLVILPFGLPHVRRAEAVIRANFGRLVFLGFLSVTTYNTLLYAAAHTTTSLNITLVNSTNPLAIAVLAGWVLGMRTTRRQILGFAVAGAGILAIVSRGDWRVLAGFDWHVGDLLMVLAVLAWGVYSVYLRKWKIDIHPIGLLTVTIAVGVAFLLPAYLWEVANFGHFVWRPSHLPIFVFLAIFPSVLAFLFWNRGVMVLGPALTGLFVYLVPVFTSVLGRVVLGEQLHRYHAAGGAAILAGLLLANWPGAGETSVGATPDAAT